MQLIALGESIELRRKLLRAGVGTIVAFIGTLLAWRGLPMCVHGLHNLVALSGRGHEVAQSTFLRRLEEGGGIWIRKRLLSKR